jgi:hypothetical protein
MWTQCHIDRPTYIITKDRRPTYIISIDRPTYIITKITFRGKSKSEIEEKRKIFLYTSKSWMKKKKSKRKNLEIIKKE